VPPAPKVVAGAAVETPAQTPQVHVTSASPAASLGAAGAAPQPPATPASTFNTESREQVTASARSQNGKTVKVNLVSRLENLTASLRNQQTQAVGAQPVSVALIDRLESVTESLKSQGESVRVSPATVELVRRWENIAVRSAAPAIQPVVPVG